MLLFWKCIFLINKKRTGISSVFIIMIWWTSFYFKKRKLKVTMKEEGGRQRHITYKEGKLKYSTNVMNNVVWTILSLNKYSTMRRDVCCNPLSRIFLQNSRWICTWHTTLPLIIHSKDLINCLNIAEQSIYQHEQLPCIITNVYQRFSFCESSLIEWIHRMSN